MNQSLYEAVIGLECHVQLQTQSKAFSGAKNSFGAPPNSLTDEYTLALPGTLPVFNEKVVDAAVSFGLAVGSRIRTISRFARKHYFYPDLPKGYQITQHEEPLCEGGAIEFWFQGVKSKIPLTRIHLEEDAGKNLHLGGGRSSLVDFNRAGVPLIEIVSEPAIRSAEEAADYLRAIRQLVRFLGISDGNMDEGSLRCDANVSVRKKGDTRLGTKVELKNINSFKFVQKAIEFEIERQIEKLSHGEVILQETRGFDSLRGVTRSQRQKEEAKDYRYFIDPDLPPLSVPQHRIDELMTTLKETPIQRKDRYMIELGLTEYDAGVLTAEKELGDFFNAVLTHLPYATTEEKKGFASLAVNWLCSELLGLLNQEGKSIIGSPVTPNQLAQLLLKLKQSLLTGKMAKEVFAQMYTTGASVEEIIAQKNLVVVNDESTLESICESIIQDAEHAKQVEKYLAGQERVFGYFVGLVMKKTQGRANPEMVNMILKKLLAKKAPLLT